MINVRLFSFSRNNGMLDRTGYDIVANAANLPNPPRSTRVKHTGLNKDLQKDFFRIKQVEAFYQALLTEIIELVEKRTIQVELELKKQAQAIEAKEKEIEEEELFIVAQEEKEIIDIDDQSISDDDNDDKEVEYGVNIDSYCVRVAVGCFAGKHRSVAIVDRLSRDERLKDVVAKVKVHHLWLKR
jgi:RNase adaptor protein for sRNA GlmZ degradation